MANKKGVKPGIKQDILNLTEYDLEHLSKKDLYNLASKGSKIANQQIRRLRNSEESKKSIFLEKRKEANKSPFVKELKVKEDIKEEDIKQTKTELKTILRETQKILSAKTASTKGTKDFFKKIAKRTGLKANYIKGLESEDWQKIRGLIEKGSAYSSDDAIQSYEKTTRPITEEEFLNYDYHLREIYDSIHEDGAYEEKAEQIREKLNLREDTEDTEDFVEYYREDDDLPF